jgi:2,4-dienoyl-CoA reductase-like NADH-dependent reductase (Old Yellow Enzyme family)
VTARGHFVYLGEAVKEAVRVPVVGVGNVMEPAYADRIVREGREDLVGVGRAMLADPD